MEGIGKKRKVNGRSVGCTKCLERGGRGGGWTMAPSPSQRSEQQKGGKGGVSDPQQTEDNASFTVRGK